MSARVASLSRGKVRISLTRARVKPKLPAPMKAILVVQTAPLAEIGDAHERIGPERIPQVRGLG